MLGSLFNSGCFLPESNVEGCSLRVKATSAARNGNNFCQWKVTVPRSRESEFFRLSPSTLHGSGLPPPNKVETWKNLSVDLQGRMEVLVSGVIQRAGFPEPWASFLSSLSQIFCPQGQEPAARIRAGFASFSFHICRAGNSGTTLWSSHEG